ncbi:energy transducer TonB [Tenacibaculum sp. M341]|uniref:energy transducer TonB n=1 Tax=Tenacibaculum sp. M341 TaxID=2530339 RepID=UPI00104475A2|nr:energy transducer TonB [Tenacibaculum sp. M341]TCI85396.1 energy transducer TonB [Tenacibaculum sp. M341]
MKKVLYTLFIAFAISSYAQKDTCESDQNTIESLNSITKCTVQETEKKDKKKSRQLTVRVSASKKRFLKKRKRNLAATSNDLSGAGISDIQQGSNISKSLKIKTNLDALTNRLTREEVRSAQKFNEVDNLAAFPDCKGTGDQLSCFNDEMIKHIQEYFVYPDEAIVNKLEGEVWVRFIIDKEGNVTNIKALGPKGGKILKEEAIRVVSHLPKFEPATVNGEPVSIKYGFPINFSLEDL